MKKAFLFSALCAAFVITGCSKKQEPLAVKVDTNKTTEINKSPVESKKTAAEVNKTIKRTNVTINSYTDCPTFKTNDYKTIPYE